MKTLGFAIALSLTGTAAQAATLFEIPINGGIARFELDENCQQSVCASLSWTENDRQHSRQARKNMSKQDTARPSAKLASRSAEKPASSEPAPATATSAEPPAPLAAPPAGSPGASTMEPPPASGDTAGAVDAPGEPVREPKAVVARLAPAQPAPRAQQAPAAGPVGEWLVEGGEARIRIDECAKNLCGIVSAASNANETDRKNPKPELRNRPIIGMPVLLDMRPAGTNRWEGRIYNAKNGQTYDANISLVDSQSLRVEGCVFGGFICGGQNWTRVD
jgi:uncharacterized protein (DUF2147 family)